MQIKEGLKRGLSIRGTEWNLAKLKHKGKLKRMGPAKGGYLEILKCKKRG